MAKSVQQPNQLSLFDDTFFNDGAVDMGEDDKSQNTKTGKSRESVELPSSSTPLRGSCVADELRSRAKRMRLRVTFADGKEICDVSATLTMMRTIDCLGVERVAELGMELCHVPLVSTSVSAGLERWTKEIRPGWYLMVQSDTTQKYMQLKAIVDKLGENVKVELGTFDSFVCSTNNRHDEKTRKKKARLAVTFPNGTEVCSSDAMHTFIEVVETIGVEKLKKTNLKFAGKDIISLARKAKNQQQLKSGEWITVPSQIKDKYKVLRVVSSMTHVPLDIKIFD